MKTKDLLGVLLFCLVIRGACTLLILNKYPGDEFYLDLIFQSGTEILTIVLCKFLMKINCAEMKNIIGGGIGIKRIAVAMASGTILVMFTMGENAVEAIVIAQFDPRMAFGIWNFQTVAKEVHPLFSLHVLSFLAVACLVAPICEELFFRGFLLRSLLRKKSLCSAVVINCAIFTALHFLYEYYISTFVFSLFMCSAYLITRSILFCILAHATYNFFAFLQNYSLNAYFTKSIDKIVSPAAWIPEIFSLGLSLMFISYFFFKFRKSINGLD
ncbi:CPBP family intramembrane metalloprotease [Duganella sp. BJB488]|uniref:CPBP family intramembrane glutamic endopeptidase n=1 Tax=unclassified Duganella TaxID=2636909 RepID=UPI000E3509CC|nr:MULTISPECIES: CPBP family intramembrane glutamic endopeptidase [unclassified Duganella]RFP26025.1 CPBP family intramembrane metalloprotease [Duganella sp. BJB489]RFP28234.1 CPBP family intramembrane metalloprotease [Duganella sp. BJB488]RFP36955.1 CPBP family intramembrane metalloprotease [Duganella sp. BJB480]